MGQLTPLWSKALWSEAQEQHDCVSCSQSYKATVCVPASLLSHPLPDRVVQAGTESCVVVCLYSTLVPWFWAGTVSSPAGRQHSLPRGLHIQRQQGSTPLMLQLSLQKELSPLWGLTWLGLAHPSSSPILKAKLCDTSYSWGWRHITVTVPRLLQAMHTNTRQDS